MINTDFSQLKATLEAKLASTATGSDMRADIVIQQSSDTLDQTQFAAERDLTVSLLNRNTKMFHRVRAALRRMEDETYGVCLACEDPISPKRLQAVPWAELCLGCQERSDLRATGVLTAGQDEGFEAKIG
jgi:DnaK suppressor protein